MPLLPFRYPQFLVDFADAYAEPKPVVSRQRMY